MSRDVTTDYTTLTIGSTSQNILESTDDRISWGHLTISALNGPSLSTTLSSAESSRSSFVNKPSQALPPDDDDRTRPANEDWPVLALSFTLTSKPDSAESTFLLLAYDEIKTMDFFGTALD